MCPIRSDWRYDLTDAEKDFLRSNWISDLPQLSESLLLVISCMPGRTGCAVTIRQSRGCTWVVFGSDGKVLDYGEEDTLEEASTVAIELKQAWRHRCDAHCEGVCHGRCTQYSGNIVDVTGRYRVSLGAAA